MAQLDIQLSTHTGSMPTTANARRAWTTRRGILLRVRTPDGLVGMGEASPLPGYSPDSLAAARDALEAWVSSPSTSGAEIVDLDSVQRHVDRLPSTVPSARFAVETALLDLLGQRRQQPIARLLIDDSAAGSDPIAGTQPVAALVDLLERPVDCAQRHLAAGITTLKAKIGRPGRFADEIRALDRVRAAAGSTVRLRLDANGTLPVAALESHLHRLAECQPELVEEPVAAEAWLDLRQPPVATALDESLRSLEWQKLRGRFETMGCVALVLKPTVLGGLLSCRRWARRARAEGLASIVSHAFEGPVALQAAAHLAVGLAIGPAHGLARHAGLDAWPRADGLLVEETAIARPSRNGLGLTVGIP